MAAQVLFEDVMTLPLEAKARLLGLRGLDGEEVALPIDNASSAANNKAIPTTIISFHQPEKSPTLDSRAITPDNTERGSRRVERGVFSLERRECGGFIYPGSIGDGGCF